MSLNCSCDVIQVSGTCRSSMQQYVDSPRPPRPSTVLCGILALRVTPQWLCGLKNLTRALTFPRRHSSTQHGARDGVRDSPDEIQQGVGGAGHRLLAVLGVLLLCRPARMDDVDHDDAHHHRHKGGPEVVGDGHDAQAARALGVQGGQTGHQAEAEGANMENRALEVSVETLRGYSCGLVALASTCVRKKTARRYAAADVRPNSFTLYVDLKHQSAS